MRIGTALLTAACIISGIVVIEAHSDYAAEAPNPQVSEDPVVGTDEVPLLTAQ